MKNQFIISVWFASMVMLVACSKSTVQQQPQETFTNPIIQGFYPDPSICKAGDAYYMVQSSFSYFPGLPIFKSNDLVNWKQIGHVMDRPSQLDTDGAGISRGLFAPTIRYNNGLFYVVCTLIDKGGNFIVTAKDPAGPWSEPIYFPEVNGIDPSIFFDNDKTYLVYNSIPPNNVTEWNGHRTIRMYEIDKGEMKIKGEEILLVNGGTDVAIKPVWIEAPHIYKINDYYYLMCAQGGTGFNHTEVVFRSKEVKGPYEPYEQNPILTQKHLDSNRPFPITTTGHADIVQTDDGEWWAVFLGCRPYEAGYYNMGRETFLTPVKWENDWPIINPDFEEVQYSYPAPKGVQNEDDAWPTGNFELIDNFDTEKLDFIWTFMRTPKEAWHSLSEKPGNLTLNTRPETCSELSNPSFIGRRQQHIKCSASVALDFDPSNENEKAGLVIFQGEKNYYFLSKSIKNDITIIELYQSTDSIDTPATQLTLLASKEITNAPIDLKISSEGSTYSFYYKLENENWQLLQDQVDGRFLSTREAGGFVGSFFGMYTTSMGTASTSKAHFDWFNYVGDDDVYKTLK